MEYSYKHNSESSPIYHVLLFILKDVNQGPDMRQDLDSKLIAFLEGDFWLSASAHTCWSARDDHRAWSQRRALRHETDELRDGED